MALVDIRFGSGPVPTTGRPVIIRKKKYSVQFNNFYNILFMYTLIKWR